MKNNIDIDKLEDKLNNANDLDLLNDSLNSINESFNKLCNSIYKNIFDYKFSKYLYYHYIILNETKYEIAIQLNMSPSTVWYYISKYKIKKDNYMRQQKMLDTMKETCSLRYGVEHPGQLESTHKNRITNILNKTNNGYNQYSYPKLIKSNSTKFKMKKSQQARRKKEKQG